MNNKKLLCAFAVAAFAGSAFLFVGKHSNDTACLYKPRVSEKSEKEMDANGYIQWRFNQLRDPITNTIPFDAVLNARAQAEQMSQMKSAVSLNWKELGPDNVGGRTLALLIDKNNPNHIFAGAAGGGLWISNDGGSSWSNYSDQLADLAVSGLCQAANGDIYFGTGEGTYFQAGIGAGGLIGKGIYKSTDGGVTFNSIANTVPTPNSASVDWATVTRMAASPTDPNYIAVAMNRGVRITKDGGATWYNPVRVNMTGAQITSSAQDVEIQADGTCFAVVGNLAYKSPDGNDMTFAKISNGGNTSLPNGGISRLELALSPDDDNYLYAVAITTAGDLKSVYQSTDRGTTWNVIGNGSSIFDPFNAEHQGDYDLDLAVYPGNKYHILLAGVIMFQWTQSVFPPNAPAGSWTQVDGFFLGNYVHPDKHVLLFKKNSNVVYVGCDGGVFRSNNGGQTWMAMNKGYNTTQCYSVAYTASGKEYFSGMQDNGTQYIDSTANVSQNNGYMDAVAIGGGDGADCEASIINPSAFYSTIYYGYLARSSNKGSSMSQFYNVRITKLTGYEKGGFASFVTPTDLWESLQNTASVDSVLFTNPIQSQLIEIANGVKTTWIGNLTLPQTSAKVKPYTVKITDGIQTFTDNGLGILVGPGLGNVNYLSGSYTVTFTTPPAPNSLVTATFGVYYNAGDVLTITSGTSSYPFLYTTTTPVDTLDSLKIQDIVSSRIFVGFTGDNGIWLCKKPLDFSVTPAWVKIGGTKSLPTAYSGEAQTLCASPDGNHLYVGTSGGQIFRISGINQVVDSINGDVEVKQGNSMVVNPNCVVTCTQIGNSSGRTITRISVDPNNSDRIIVCIGNYGFTDHVWYCSSATTAPNSGSMSNFTNKTGNLPAMPTYGAVIEMSNPNNVIVGTEYGVWATNDISVGSPAWTSQNATMSNAATFMVRQQWHKTWTNLGWGDIYIGTHGRGMWKSTSMSLVPTGIGHDILAGHHAAKADVKVFPNPVSETATIQFFNPAKGKVTMEIYSIQGQKMKMENYGQLASGTYTFSINAAELPAGTYFVNVYSDAQNAVGKFVVSR